MKVLKYILKYFFILLIIVFILLSIIPYFFSDNLNVAVSKPYSNSYFFSYNHTNFHFRLFVPKHIQHKTVLVHGFSASTFSFRHNIDSLISNNHLVVAMDMPAFGYSDKTETANYTDTNKIQSIHFLLTMINKLTNHQQWNLIGHSMGGTVIGQFASAYPQETNSLIFIDGLPFSSTHSSLQNIILYPPLLKWADIILKYKFLNVLSFQELLSSAYGQPADKLSVAGYMEPFKIQNSGSSIFRMAAHSGYAMISDSVINIIPKLIIWGKKDQWIPIENATDYFSKPNTTSLVVPNAGHCPMETHPEKVNAAITNFISNLD